MIPIRDNIPSRHLPVVNWAIIGLCVAVFAIQVAAPANAPPLAEQYGMVPARLLNPDEPVVIERKMTRQTLLGPQEVVLRKTVVPAAVPDWLTLLTSVFLHGNLVHILGNMWFLFIFGDNVEDRFGHTGYLLFYVGTGVLASVAHLMASPSSPLPTVGASGAIAGVMGAYLLLYPRATVLTVIPLFVFWQVVALPAPIFLGIWFLFQFFQGVFIQADELAGGVAWWAHIGGFVVGLALAGGLSLAGVLRPPVRAVAPRSSPLGPYRVYPRQRW